MSLGDQPGWLRAALLVVVAVGLVVRLPGLGRDLSGEESTSFYDARGVAFSKTIVTNGPEVSPEALQPSGSWQAVLLATSHLEYHPPLYFLLLRAWTGIAGESNRALRLFSVLLAAATVPAVFFLGRTLFSSEIGLAAAAVCAILPSHVQFSNQVRPYALAVLLVTAASWAFWSACQALGQPGEKRLWAIYAVLAAAALYTHYLAAGVFLAHGCFALLQNRSERHALLRRLAAVAGAILLLSSPWFLSSYFRNELELEQISSGARVYWTPGIPRQLLVLPYSVLTGYLPGRHKYIPAPITLSAYLVSAAVLLVAARRRKPPPRALLFGFLLLLLPLLSIFFLAEANGNPYLLEAPRYVLFAVPGASLLLGAALGASPRKGLAAFWIAAILLAAYLQYRIMWGDGRWYYGSISSAVAELNRKAGPDRLVLFEDKYLLAYWNIYQTTPSRRLVLGEDSPANRPAMDFEPRWREVEQRYCEIYLVRTTDDPPGEAASRLASHYRLLGRERIDYWEIRHYQKPSCAPGSS